MGLGSVNLVPLTDPRRKAEDARKLVAAGKDGSGALDLTTEPFDRVGGVDLDPMFLGEGHGGQDALLGFMQERRQLRQLRSDLISGLAHNPDA
jgi:hypothetical protein